MDPAIASAIGFAIAEIAKAIPELAIDIISTLAKKDATEADWQEKRDKWKGRSYDEYRNASRQKTTT